MKVNGQERYDAPDEKEEDTETLPYRAQGAPWLISTR